MRNDSFTLHCWVVVLVTVALFGALPLLAGERSDAFVAAARKAYAADPMCRTTVVTNFVVKGTPDDKAPGLVRWYDVEGARNVRDIGDFCTANMSATRLTNCL